MTTPHATDTHPVSWPDRFAAVLVEQYCQEKVFDVALADDAEAKAVSSSLRAMGYIAEVLPPGDRIRVTCP